MMRAEEFEKISKAARQAYAIKHLNLDEVSTRIAERARSGHRFIRLEQEDSFDLSKTQAAGILIAKLKKQGFQFKWEVTCFPGDILRPGSAIEYVELEIWW